MESDGCREKMLKIEGCGEVKLVPHKVRLFGAMKVVVVVVLVVAGSSSWIKCIIYCIKVNF